MNAHENINLECADVLEKLLTGNSQAPEVIAHLEKCEDCRSAAESLSILSRASKTEMPSPPSRLDDAIKKAAADNIIKHKSLKFKFMPFILWVGGIAAVFAVSFLTLSPDEPGSSEYSSSRVAAVSTEKTADSIADDWDMTDINSDLASIYGNARAATESMEQADIHTSQLEYGYVAYSQYNYLH